jgi:succinoglycan biosynthesis transport protein ExoP
VQALPASQQTGQGSLGERLASLQALRAGPDPTISVESLATLPTSPSWPKTKLSIIAGILVGLVIGIGSAFVIEGVDPRIRREETVRRIFHLPILARVPRERHGTGYHVPLHPNELSPLSLESYRMLRVALGLRGASLVDEHSGHARSLMITGSTSSEGKSTVSLNLAWAHASAGHRVILLEADVRRPSLGSTLGIQTSHGIAGVLMHEIDLEDALVTIDTEGASGSIKALLVEHAGQYLADGLLARGPELVERASSLAEYVIVDAPPVTEVGDALPLSQYVDDVIVVARLGHTRTDRLVDLGEILARQGVRPAGVVIVGEDFGHWGGYYAESTPQPRGLKGRLPINA